MTAWSEESRFRTSAAKIVLVDRAGNARSSRSWLEFRFSHEQLDCFLSFLYARAQSSLE